MLKPEVELRGLGALMLLTGALSSVACGDSGSSGYSDSVPSGRGGTTAGGAGAATGGGGVGVAGGASAGTSGLPEAPAAADDSLEAALKAADPRRVPESVVMAAAVGECQSSLKERQALWGALLGADPVRYAPSTSSQLIAVRPDLNARLHPLIVGAQGNVLTAAGFVGTARVSAWGEDAGEWSKVAGQDATLGGIATRTLEWQSGGSAPKQAALLRFGGREKALRAWLEARYPGIAVSSCDDTAAAASCSKDSPLLFLGADGGTGTGTQEERDLALKVALRARLVAGKPLVYMHTGGWGTGNSGWVGELVGFDLPYAGNYFADDAADWMSHDAAAQAWPDKLDPDAAICRVLGHFDAADYAFDWTPCASRECSEVVGFNDEFLAGANALRDRVSALERHAQSVFAPGTARLTQLAVLLGDKFRLTQKFPLQKQTDSDAFLRALWADHGLSTLRPLNPPLDLAGSSFSPVLPSTLESTAVTREFATRGPTVERSAAAYALPGRSFQVHRTDSGTSEVRVFVNMIRYGANHALDGEKYDRPMHLWGHGIPLRAGETLTLTSAVGGLVFVSVGGATPSVTVKLEFSGVGAQPVYDGEASAAAFQSVLASTPFGWAELLTPGLEVHSTTEKMRKSVEEYGGDAKLLAADTWTYLYKGVYGLAGFLGKDLVHPPTVTAFCTDRGWDCGSAELHGLEGVQHINADQANCGYLCSGNPVDSYANFSPSGWGESHELGHNLQYGDFRIYDGLSGEVSNNIFPTYTYLKWNETHPNDRRGRSLLQEDVFQLLQTAQKDGDPSAYVKSRLWSEGDGSLFWGRLLFYWQAVLTSQDVKGLGDGGWDLYRLMYLHSRLLRKARGSDADWAASRATLGFSAAAYAARDTSVSSNDHFLIAMSWLTQRDQRPFFDLWGVSYSADARAQVAAFAFPAAAKRFFVVPCEEQGFGPALPNAFNVDGATAWPTAGDCPAK